MIIYFKPITLLFEIIINISLNFQIQKQGSTCDDKVGFELYLPFTLTLLSLKLSVYVLIVC